MSPWDPLDSGGVSELAVPALEHAARPQPLKQQSWDEAFRAMAPERQRELCALARLHAHHPENGNGNGHAPVFADQQRIVSLLSGQTQDLEPLLPVAVELCDSALDEVQQALVARALATPDVFLLHGLPGTGKSRVIAEIVTQAALRGERVLLLAPIAAPLDHILENIGQREVLCPIRCLGEDESPESLPPSVRALTFAERLRQLGDEPIRRARQELAESEGVCRRHHHVNEILERLQSLAEKVQELDVRAAALKQPRAAIIDDLTPRCEQLARALVEMQPSLDALGTLAASKGRWWTANWWRALFHGNVVGELATLDAARKQIDADLDVIRVERARRLDAELAAVAEAKATHEQTWRATCNQLVPDCPRPDDVTREAVDQTRTICTQLRDKDEKQLAHARHWLTCLEESASTLDDRLVRYANLVAATTGSLANDPQFGDERASKFDLLILQNADQVTRAEFLRLARRARRAILVGDVDLRATTDSDVKNALPRAGAILKTGFFRELWQALHCDPRSLPGEWLEEKHRIHCRLKPIAAEQRQWLESERLADRPEIELRILNLPRAKPVLAEVVFPSSMSLAQAKSYIFQELQELPIRASGSQVRWSVEDERTILHLGPAHGDMVRICLDNGVHEIVARSVSGSNGEQTAVWTTGRIEFDHKAGWQRPRMVEWLARYLNLRDAGRTACLEVSQRMRPELAAFVGDLLFAGGYHLGQNAAAQATQAVEFIPVGLKPETNGKHNGKRPGPRHALPKAGAGLELDLSDIRHRDRLPNELRPALPEHGLVNYLEAQAVVRFLEGLMAVPNQVSDLAVIALYPAQALLIRQLVKQSPILSASNLDSRIDVPAAFQEREFSTVIVSLTRSHAHRAVTFGDSPRSLELALTRVRNQLVLFGDPGTLVRRTQWTQAVDHLDASASQQEHDVIARLVGYLEGHGSQAQSFHLRVDGASCR